MLSAEGAHPQNPVGRGASVVWHSLPLFLLAGIVIAAVWTVARTSLLLVWPGMLIVLALLAALAWGFAAMMEGNTFCMRDLASHLPRAAFMTVRLMWPAAVSLALSTVAFHVATASGQEWMLFSGGAGLAMAAALGTVGLLALIAAEAGPASGPGVWTRGLRMLVSAPMGGGGALAGFLLAGWATMHLSFALLILLPIPLTAIWVAAYMHAKGTAAPPERP